MRNSPNVTRLERATAVLTQQAQETLRTPSITGPVGEQQLQMSEWQMEDCAEKALGTLSHDTCAARPVQQSTSVTAATMPTHEHPLTTDSRTVKPQTDDEEAVTPTFLSLFDFNPKSRPNELAKATGNAPVDDPPPRGDASRKNAAGPVSGLRLAAVPGHQTR